MKTKTFSMNTEAIDSRGNKHIVTIVGVLTQDKEKVQVTIPCSSDEIDEVAMASQSKFKMGQPLQGVFTAEKKVMKRTLKYGYSICHTADLPNFSEEKGVKVALKRINNGSVIGELSTSYCTALCDDQIDMILLNELIYVRTHIDAYINRRKGF